MGLLMISPAFLASSYITEKELPVFVAGEKACVPVMLQPVDFDLHDLKGLEKRQIFIFDYVGFKEPRGYGECKSHRRNAFVLELFREIEKKLEKRRKGNLHLIKTTDPLADLRIFELAAQAYRRRGTPKHFLDSQTLTNQQRAELYDRVVLSERGRPAKNNPYRMKWEIEKKKETRAARRKKIDSWRSYVDKHFNWDSFRDTSVFSEMKPFLSEKTVKELDPYSFDKTKSPTVHLRSPIGRDDLKMRLLDEITSIEMEKWKLL
jgi:hypothetical protein